MDASLELGFGPNGAMVVLRCPPAMAPHLQRLATAFSSAVVRAPEVVEVAVDDLLVSLRELASWPDPAGVVWADDLRALVEDVVRDAETARTELAQPGDLDVADADVESLLGPLWQGPLTTQQQRDVAKLLRLRHGANFSVPGAGKTRVALALYDILRTRGEVRRLVVVAPKSAFESWTAENATCFGDAALSVDVYDGAVDPSAEAVLINYERLPDAQATLIRVLRARPALLVLDEAHRMKLGPRGAYGAACLALGPHARRRLILTGTPAPNGAADLESLLGFVWPGHGRQSVANAVASGDLRAASTLLRPLFTRTTKAELDLPAVDLHVGRVDLPPLHREVYAALCGQLSRRATAASGDLDALGRIVVYLLMAAISPALLAVGTTRHEPLSYRVPPLDVPPGATIEDLLRDLPSYELSPKFAAAARIVAANAADGRKTIVWSTFIRSLTTLERMLAPYRPAVVHGGSVDRTEQLARFRDDPDCAVLLTNPATLGEGISLHLVCHDAVYVDRDFAAGRYLQSLDRIHRLGLPHDARTTVTVLVANATIDEVVEQRLAVKLQFMSTVLDDPAVQQLADLTEDPTVGAGLDSLDVSALMGHLRGATA